MDWLLDIELQTKVPKVRKHFTIIEKAPTRAFSWLKVPTIAFTFKTLLRHFAKQALTHGKSSVLNVKAVVTAFNQDNALSRGLLHDYEPSCGPSFEALLGPPGAEADKILS